MDLRRFLDQDVMFAVLVELGFQHKYQHSNGQGGTTYAGLQIAEENNMTKKKVSILDEHGRENSEEQQKRINVAKSTKK
ncbi:unnamed protein product [Haemonchus placei]|uniref:Uncharacterized protein n=1 Tax=Haemonchus placei TaxID=6290 RepID=A0A0N4WIA0_HAEPC|nr:unnamed protein product [Haemonchus placei]